MGVPSYFFWLVKKFEEQILKEVDSQSLNDRDRPDNLFLDWNCGIHPAIKKPGLNTMESKIQAVLDYLDKIFELVKPRKLFYVAIDGVAPRAKMQQQRKRRFKSVQDAIFTKKLMEKHNLLKVASKNSSKAVSSSNDSNHTESKSLKIAVKDVEVPEIYSRASSIISSVIGSLNSNTSSSVLHQKTTTNISNAENTQVGDEDLVTEVESEQEAETLELSEEEKEWDYNMISPGTIFMDLLSREIKAHLLKKSKEYNVNIIVSDSSIPGEGEHKIMKYIREEVSMSEKNMVYGLDSDLIFLSLINFRPNMSLLREKVEFGDKLKVGTKRPEKKLVIGGEQDIKADIKVVGWVLLSIDSLRDVFLQIFNPYLSLRELENFGIFSSRALDRCNEMFYKDDDYQTYVERMLHERFYHEPDIEGKNIIIDYIFISFMLGNDFLPPIVSLQIKESGLDHLIRAYKMTLITMRQNLILLETGPTPSSNANSNSNNFMKEARHFRINTPFFIRLLEICTSFELPLLRQAQRNKMFRISRFKTDRRWNEATSYEKDMLDLDYVEDKVPDYIQLGEEGWASRYYDVHFHLNDRNEHESKKYIMGICDHYMRGMIWTLQYYLTGTPDWTWEYPFHSSPTVHDLLEYVRNPSLNNSYKIYRELGIAGGTIIPSLELSNTSSTSAFSKTNTKTNIKNKDETKIVVTKPVSPLEQLMCILPPASAHLLPQPVQEIMKLEALAVYYPLDFALDIFGHRYRWESHPLLPNIPAEEIKRAIMSIEPYLTEEEMKRNSVGEIYIIKRKI